jgi:hypothetical protein
MAIKVLDTQTVSASASAYIIVKTGIIRCTCATASTIAIDDGPAIQLPGLGAGATELHVGHPKKSRLNAATDAAAMVVTVDGGGTPAHNFSVGDFVTTVNGGDTNFAAAFVSAASAGKKVTAVTNTTITTDIDSSAAAADYALATAQYAVNEVPELQRIVKLTAGSVDVVVEQIQGGA